jgi:replicative DNA helicase
MTTQTTTLDLPLNGNVSAPKNLVSLLDDLDSDRRQGTAERPRFATGFDPLDTVLDGGLRRGDLTLIGGLPGVGKTITALQWARSFALAGHPVVYACYEHEERELLGRLLALEIAEEGGDEEARFKFRRVLREVLNGRAWLEQEVLYEPRLRPAYERLSSYADRLWVIKASGSNTGVSELAQHVEQAAGGAQVLVVDYLQKVAPHGGLVNDGDRVTRVTEGLKELALQGSIAVLAIASADREGLGSPRLRLQHLRGSSALAYEADLAILLNEKHRIVSKMHLTYDPVRAEDFHNTVVFSLEKYRAGQANLDLEFRKEFASYRFNPAGGHVFDRLIDGRLDPD